eukprot:403331550
MNDSEDTSIIDQIDQKRSLDQEIVETDLNSLINEDMNSQSPTYFKHDNRVSKQLAEDDFQFDSIHNSDMILHEKQQNKTPSHHNQAEATSNQSTTQSHPNEVSKQRKMSSSSLMNTSFGNLSQNDDEERDLLGFFKQEKVFIILTNAGKPVYSSYGDIYQMSPIIATLYAIISKVNTFKFNTEYINPLEKEEHEARVKAEQNRLTLKIQNRLSTAIQKVVDREDESVNYKPLITTLLPSEIYEPDDDKQATRILSIATITDNFKIAFMHKGDCLLYIALSKSQNESQTALKRQLEMIHTQLISLTTKTLIKTLRINASYDVISDVYDHHKQINYFVDNLQSDPATYLNQYLPLRMHTKVKRAIGQIVQQFKPQGIHNIYYYGLILAERTVVATVKNDPKIAIISSGMSEDYRLNLFIQTEAYSTVKIVFVTETNTPEIYHELEKYSSQIFNTLHQRKIIEVIEESELQMFEKINMREVQHCLVSNQSVEQYTAYNFPLIEPDLYSQAQIRSLQEYEKLYDRYLVSTNKHDLFIKRVYALDTYVLYAQNHLVIMATILHKRTELDSEEICKNILQEVLIDEGSCFILHAE